MKKRNFLKVGTNKGITLIALVITIVVMLILAGVTINLTLGQNGIFTTAQKAAQNYTQAQNQEVIAIDSFTSAVEKVVSGRVYYATDNVGNTIPVPLGFSPITTSDQGTKYTGFVIKNDTDGNEFVWVPVEGMNYGYGRVAWTREGWNYSQTIENGEIKVGKSVFIEPLPIDEQTSVNTYGGYYIGRYEAGVENYDTENITTSNSSITDPTEKENWTGYIREEGKELKLVVKSGQQVWNYITRNRAKTEATNLYKKENGDNVASKLCSSYAWDTALKFMESTGSTYPTNSTGGYYGHSNPTTTGYDTAHPCNIYDMGGNVWEWTAEFCRSTYGPCVNRGGGYGYYESGFPAAYRNVDSTTRADGVVSFRVTLYL